MLDLILDIIMVDAEFLTTYGRKLEIDISLPMGDFWIWRSIKESQSTSLSSPMNSKVFL